jgi:hypothetical protein
MYTGGQRDVMSPLAVRTVLGGQIVEAGSRAFDGTWQRNRRYFIGFRCQTSCIATSGANRSTVSMSADVRRSAQQSRRPPLTATSPMMQGDQRPPALFEPDRVATLTASHLSEAPE